MFRRTASGAAEDPLDRDLGVVEASTADVDNAPARHPPVHPRDLVIIAVVSLKDLRRIIIRSLTHCELDHAVYGARTCTVPNSLYGPWLGISLTRLGSSPVLVDQSAKNSMPSDRGIKIDDGRGTVAGRALVEALVRPMVVEMALVVVKDGASVSFVVDQEPVGALRTDTADDSLGIAIRLRNPGRDLDHVEAFGGEDSVEGVGELGVAVADQKAERADPLTQIPQQVTGHLGSPGRSRMRGDTKQVHRAGA